MREPPEVTVARGLSDAERERLRQALRRPGRGRVRLESRVEIDADVIERLRNRLSAAAGREIALDIQVDPRLPAGASLVFGADVRIDLEPGRMLLRDLDQQLATRPAETTTTLESTTAYLSRVIGQTAPGLRVEETSGTGRVLQVGDGVAIVAGLGGVGSQEVVRFEGGSHGIAFNLLQDAVGCLLLGPEARIAEGSAVERTGRLLHVPVGEQLIGRTVNALGQPMDGGAPIAIEALTPIEAPAPGIVQRRPVAESLHTGIKIIDALVPLGRGQRELVLGDRKIGKTTIALDVILSQRGTGVVCVYAAIGQKASSVARAVSLLRERGAMEYTIVVAALSSEPPAFRYVVPYAACAMAEAFMHRGGHALVVYDDLSKHAVTYREISALLKRPIGREAYPGDIFYVHSRLLERAARLRDDLGGGSLTAIPIVETLAGDITGLIPTNVISICDGQIVLDSALFNEGSRPAMDVGLSVSRVGGMAQTPAMRKVAGRLRLDLAQHHEMARFVKFGAEVDEATLRLLQRGERELAILRQDAHTPLPPEREIVILFAAVHGFTDNVPIERLRTFEEELYRFMEERHADVLAALRETQALPADLEERLGTLLPDFLAVFSAPLRPGAGAQAAA
jgi:F-type H+-transporting ATPase subunit alpha